MHSIEARRWVFAVGIAVQNISAPRSPTFLLQRKPEAQWAQRHLGMRPTASGKRTNVGSSMPSADPTTLRRIFFLMRGRVISKINRRGRWS